MFWGRAGQIAAAQRRNAKTAKQHDLGLGLVIRITQVCIYFSSLIPSELLKQGKEIKKK